MSDIMLALSLFAMGALIAVVAYRHGHAQGWAAAKVAKDGRDYGYLSDHTIELMQQGEAQSARIREMLDRQGHNTDGAQKPAQAEGRAYRHECRWQDRTEGDGLTLKGLPEEFWPYDAEAPGWATVRAKVDEHREGSPGP